MSEQHPTLQIHDSHSGCGSVYGYDVVWADTKDHPRAVWVARFKYEADARAFVERHNQGGSRMSMEASER